MNKDIRVLTSFKGHRKRKRFKLVLGDAGATDYLIDLWLTAAEDRPDGILAEWDEIDIALSCGWEGEPKKLIDALVETKWLDVLEDGTYALHDWSTHNAYAADAKARSEAARGAAKARWDRKLGRTKKKPAIQAEQCDNDADSCDSNADAMPEQCDSDADAMPKPEKGNAPSPSPSPSPSRNTPLTPKGENLGVKKNSSATKSQQLEKALIAKLQESNLAQHRDKLLEFFRYRMSLHKQKRYKTDKGLDGLCRDVSGCIAAGLDPGECLEVAMEREWLTPSPEYFLNKNFAGGKNAKSQRNYTGHDDRPSIIEEREFQV